MLPQKKKQNKKKLVLNKHINRDKAFLKTHFLATATAQVAKPQVVNEEEVPIDVDVDDDSENYWYTTVGKFKFAVKDLPQPLQYIYQLLQVFKLNRIH